MNIFFFLFFMVIYTLFYTLLYLEGSVIDPGLGELTSAGSYLIHTYVGQRPALKDKVPAGETGKDSVVLTRNSFISQS